MKKYALKEYRGYGIKYTVFSGTQKECEDEFDKITSNHYGDLDDRRNGDDDPWGYGYLDE